jgi:hypothetical protein
MCEEMAGYFSNILSSNCKVRKNVAGSHSLFAMGNTANTNYLKSSLAPGWNKNHILSSSSSLVGFLQYALLPETKTYSADKEEMCFADSSYSIIRKGQKQWVWNSEAKKIQKAGTVGIIRPFLSWSDFSCLMSIVWLPRFQEPCGGGRLEVLSVNIQ